MIKLYRFSKGNSATDQYVFSTIWDKEKVRLFWNIWDHGGSSFEEFKDVFTTGNIEEIISIDQVPLKHRNTIPYSTDEWVDKLGDYFNMDVDIASYFSAKDHSGIIE